MKKRLSEEGFILSIALEIEDRFYRVGYNMYRVLWYDFEVCILYLHSYIYVKLCKVDLFY